MPEYTNNLRLKEIATGDESGTWGTSTNTNLELIGEALGFGTEAITTNADTHATTIADGSTDGANVAIGPGDAKVVYLDGAGSGAAVADAFASLSVVDLKVGDDLSLNSDSAVLNIGADDDLQITHDGSNGTITNGTGDLTLDVAGDITLDADGGDILFKDGGTTIGELKNNSNFFRIKSAVNNQDMEFVGVDDTSDVVALRLDMSDAGTAAFNHDATFLDNAQIKLGAGTDMTLTSDGTNGTIATPNGDFSVDSAGEIILDSDDGVIRFKDAGTQIGNIANNSSSFHINVSVSDKDFVVNGNDGGSTITALTLDMSSAGAAIFNNDVTAFSDKRLKTDISNIENGIEKVMQMQGVHYKRNDVEDAKPQIGVLAQDMEAIVPEVVLTADDEMQTKSVDYGKLTAVLIEAIKDLKAEIDELKKG